MGRELFGWILVGLLAGVAARLIAPRRVPGGFVVSLLLGIAGALAGGFLARGLADGALGTPESVSAAIAGAVLLIFLYRTVMYARTR